MTSLSSTMYQNANGVNIYNNTLAVGDSYAHIDGDSFDIKEVTSAGTIDDANDITLATFGASETTIGAVDDVGNRVKITSSGIDVVYGDSSVERGWRFTTDAVGSHRTGSLQEDNATLTRQSLEFGVPPQSSQQKYAKYGNDECILQKRDLSSIFQIPYKTTIAGDEIRVQDEHQGADTFYSKMTPSGVYVLNDLISTKYTSISGGDIELTGHVLDSNGNNLTPTILESSTISASTTSYTFTDDAITADSTVEVFDEIDGFEYTTCSASAGSCTITFPAQSTSHKIKLHVW